MGQVILKLKLHEMFKTIQVYSAAAGAASRITEKPPNNSVLTSLHSSDIKDAKHVMTDGLA